MGGCVHWYVSIFPFFPSPHLPVPSATRCQLTVLKGVASEQLDPRERFRSQLELCRILLEANRDNREGFAGGAETAAKMCRRVRRRARDADAREEFEQAEALLEECRKAMDGEEEEVIDQGEEDDRYRRVIGGRGKVTRRKEGK